MLVAVPQWHSYYHHTKVLVLCGKIGLEAKQGAFTAFVPHWIGPTLSAV